MDFEVVLYHPPLFRCLSACLSASLCNGHFENRFRMGNITNSCLNRGRAMSEPRTRGASPRSGAWSRDARLPVSLHADRQLLSQRGDLYLGRQRDLPDLRQRTLRRRNEHLHRCGAGLAGRKHALASIACSVVPCNRGRGCQHPCHPCSPC